MAGFRFRIAQALGKVCIWGMRLLGRKATHAPGVVVTKIDPNYLRHLTLPDKVIVVTGTNGKTTVSNMVKDYLEKMGFSVANNSYGSNTRFGIASALLDNSDLKGRVKTDYVLLEMDERSCLWVLPYIRTDYLLVTNLFSDSYSRNAHPDFIFSLLDRYIQPNTKLLLNAEDPISNRLALDNDRVYYSIPLLEGEEEERHSRVQDLVNCPVCQTRLEVDFIRYNHIGHYHCPNCGYRSPEPTYRVVRADLEGQNAVLGNGKEEASYKLPTSNIVDLYNILSATSILQELGFPLDKIAGLSEAISVVRSRFNLTQVGDKALYTTLAKALNPIATSRTMAFLKKEASRKAVVLANTEYKGPKMTYVENTAWLYDNDFRYLADPSIVQVICCGKRSIDYALCLALAGVPEEKVVICENHDEIADKIAYDRVDQVWLLRDTDPDELFDRMHDQIQERMEAAL